MAARTITSSTECETCCCFSGSAVESRTGGNPRGPCVHFLTAETTPVQQSGFYLCIGGVDDQATITWAGGSFFSPAEPDDEPDVGPCYGAHGFSFSSFFNKGNIVKCEAGSWGGNVGCEIRCCSIDAP